MGFFEDIKDKFSKDTYKDNGYMYEDAEEARSSRTMACVTFGILMLIIGGLMILLHW